MIELNLLELYRIKMRNKFILFFAFLISNFSIGQSAGTHQKEATEKVQLEATTAANKKQNDALIQNTFSSAAIQAYENQAISRIEDFYAYLNLLAVTQEVAEQNEIKLAIEALFSKNQFLVTNFIKPETKVTLAQLLNNSCNQKLTFELSNARINEVGPHFFLVEYNLKMKSEMGESESVINQKVLFYPQIKEFGEIKKQVWQLELFEF